MALDVFEQAEAWLARGESVALATVVKTGGSSPRPLGSMMAIAASGAFAGSVSGGCIEGAVIEEAKEVLETGQVKRVEYGIADEQAWAVGLSCGGEIAVFIERLAEPGNSNDWLVPLHEALSNEQDVTSLLVTRSARESTASQVGQRSFVFSAAEANTAGVTSPATKRAVLEHGVDPALIETLLALGPGTHQCGSVEAFVHSMAPPPKLIIVGAVHIAEHLVHFAKRLGFHCIVVDARAAFASPEKFGHADSIRLGWPSEILKELPLRRSTYCAFLTHDPKFDDDGIKLALDIGVRYVGALGSKRTHKQRRERLLAAGVPAVKLERIDAPIGLDLGGRRPEEIALAIAARLVSVRAEAASGSASDAT